MKKNICFLTDKDNVYYKLLTEAIIDELQEICPDAKCGYVSNVKSMLKANLVIVCGNESLPKGLFLGMNLLNKPYIFYHVHPDNPSFKKNIRKAKWAVIPVDAGGYTHYPSPVLLSDIPTARGIDRVWKRERLVSKRGCIGIIISDMNEESKKKLFYSLNLLIEDLDLNIVFIPLTKQKAERDFTANIKYSANVRYIESNEYTAKDLLGIMSRIDFLVTQSEEGAICALAVNRPVIGLSVGDGLKQLLGNIVQEEIVLDLSKLSGDELYSRLKVAWVHKASIAEQQQAHSINLKKQAEEGIQKLCKGFIEP